jgi:hypothetical protein
MYLHRAQSFCPRVVGAVYRPASIFTQSTPEDPGDLSPGPNSGETEQLLDLDGLLEIARLIEEIKTKPLCTESA